MKELKYAAFLFGAVFLIAAPAQAQFVSATSTGVFHVVSAPDNSTEGINATGSGVSGDFLWDANNLFLRIVINNLNGTPGFPDNGVMTSFGFAAPASVNPNLVTLDNQSPTVSFVYAPNGTYFPGSPPGFFMEAGAHKVGFPGQPNDGNGLGAGETAFFDFNFSASGITAAEFSFEGFGYGDIGGPFDVAFRFQSVGFGNDTEGSDLFGGYVIPEPSTYGLAGIGLLAGLILLRRMKKQKNT